MIVDNPLYITQDIFSPKAKNLPNYSTFIESFYPNWIALALLAELDATRMYPIVQDRIKNNKYVVNTEYKEDVNLLVNQLSVMHDDEEEHSKVFENLLINSNKQKLFYSGDDITKISMEHWDVSLVNTLTHYYIGESYLFVCFYKIYKSTTDANIKAQIKKLLIDESNHNTNIYKILKKIQPSVQLDKEYFLLRSKTFRYFNSFFVFDFFGMSDVPTPLSDRDKAILKTVYNNEWQKEFTRYYLKKLHKLIILFYPHISKNDLAKMIYEDEMEWAV